MITAQPIRQFFFTYIVLCASFACSGSKFLCNAHHNVFLNETLAPPVTVTEHEARKMLSSDEVQFTSSELHILLKTVTLEMNKTEIQQFSEVLQNFIRKNLLAPTYRIMDYDVNLSGQALMGRDINVSPCVQCQPKDNRLAVNVVVTVTYLHSDSVTLDPAGFHRYLRLLINARGEELIRALKERNEFYFGNIFLIGTLSSPIKLLSLYTEREQPVNLNENSNGFDAIILPLFYSVFALALVVISVVAIQSYRKRYFKAADFGVKTDEEALDEIANMLEEYREENSVHSHLSLNRNCYDQRCKAVENQRKDHSTSAVDSNHDIGTTNATGNLSAAAVSHEVKCLPSEFLEKELAWSDKDAKYIERCPESMYGEEATKRNNNQTLHLFDQDNNPTSVDKREIEGEMQSSKQLGTQIDNANESSIDLSETLIVETSQCLPTMIPILDPESTVKSVFPCNSGSESRPSHATSATNIPASPPQNLFKTQTESSNLSDVHEAINQEHFSFFTLEGKVVTSEQNSLNDNASSASLSRKLPDLRVGTDAITVKTSDLSLVLDSILKPNVDGCLVPGVECRDKAVVEEAQNSVSMSQTSDQSNGISCRPHSVFLPAGHSFSSISESDDDTSFHPGLE
mmetsp:Transcript_13445/g.20451  ORF Transcript_13445/g.20451 Transcript_13445/m.20451 type:complete len:629 (+) Transcript_13445:120-2006(+)